MLGGMLSAGLVLFGCDQGESPKDTASADKAAAPSATAAATAKASASAKAKKPASPPLRKGGRFVAWIQHHKGMFESPDGRTWKRVPGEAKLAYNWTPWLTADASGTLWATSISEGPEVQSSRDGLQWTKVALDDKSPKERLSFALCAGAKDQLFTVTSDGRTMLSIDGGKVWAETSRAAPDGAKGSGMGFLANCDISPNHKKVVFYASYSKPGERTIGVSDDMGSSFKNIPLPKSTQAPIQVGWTGEGIYCATYDAFYVTSDMGESWTASKPSPLLAKGQDSYGYNRWYASDGGKILVGLETPSAKNGAVFYSKDAGKSFEVLDLPYDKDPTPNTSDETIRVAYVPGS